MKITVIREREPGEISICELAVVRCLTEGMTTKAAAQRLSISDKTLDKHRNNIYKKLDIHNSVDLTHYAIAKGIVPLKPFAHLPEPCAKVEDGQ